MEDIRVVHLPAGSVTYNMRLEKANSEQVATIWEILQGAITRRKAEGSNQWQDGYPNPDTIQDDLNTDNGYVLLEEDTVVAYLAIKKNDEPEYDRIVGQWLTEGDYLVVHRVAVADAFLGKGIATQVFKQVETVALEQGILSIKVDTNFDNAPMLHIFKKLDYVYCGKVYFRGAERLAYEKVLTKTKNSK